MQKPIDNLLRYWLPGVAMVVLAVVMLVSGNRDLASVLVAVAVIALALITTPLIFPRSTDDAGAQQLAGSRTLIYWRPGCTFCIRLRMVLGVRARRAVWVNVARDPAASARVRSVNGGNETVPTVFAGGEVHTNPSPAWVRATL